MQANAPLEVHFAPHFPTLRAQRYAQRLGMWLFLSTEVLLFAGLFLGYTAYRYIYPDTFREGSLHLSATAGTLNTVILITSSLTVALALHAARNNRSRTAALLLFISVLFGLCFLGVKAWEYSTHIHEGAVPGKYFHFHEMQNMPGASLFYTIYFFTTGLHGLHVLIGMGVLSWVGVRAWRGEFSEAYHVPVELGGLYWHLVDLVWIFLYPLLYLI